MLFFTPGVAKIVLSYQFREFGIFAILGNNIRRASSQMNMFGELGRRETSNVILGEWSLETTQWTEFGQRFESGGATEIPIDFPKSEKLPYAATALGEPPAK